MPWIWIGLWFKGKRRGGSLRGGRDRFRVIWESGGGGKGGDLGSFFPPSLLHWFYSLRFLEMKTMKREKKKKRKRRAKSDAFPFRVVFQFRNHLFPFSLLLPSRDDLKLFFLRRATTKLFSPLSSFPFRRSRLRFYSKYRVSRTRRSCVERKWRRKRRLVAATAWAAAGV